MIENCAIATMDGPRHDETGTEYRRGHIESADLARRLGVRMHTHLAETREEDAYCRQALWLGTRGGACCLGRTDETGALRTGMLADIALWRLDTLPHDAIAHGPADEPHGPSGAGAQTGGDPVAALVLGPPAPLELLLVGGGPVVESGELRTADVITAARDVRLGRLRLEAGQ